MPVITESLQRALGKERPVPAILQFPEDLDFVAVAQSLQRMNLFNNVASGPPFPMMEIPFMRMMAVPVMPETVDFVVENSGAEKAFLNKRVFGFGMPSPFDFGPLKRTEEGFYLTPDGRQIWISTQTIKQMQGVDVWNKAGFAGQGTTLAVLDTGLDNIHPSFGGGVTTYSTVMGEAFGDANGHGTECASGAYGLPAQNPLNGIVIEGMAPGCTKVAGQVLGRGIGMGFASEIIDGMIKAVQQYLADVISMSLGGDIDGSYEDDAMVQTTDKLTAEYEVIFVDAAGNSGPKTGTVASPGWARSAVTVGSISILDKQPAYFSSRGPTPDGQIKPDCVDYGGGRQTSNLQPDEMQYAAAIGLLDGSCGDWIKDRFTPMHGTSQATPITAGKVAIGRQYFAANGVKLTAEMVKKILKTYGGQKDIHRGWGILNIDWFQRYYVDNYGIPKQDITGYTGA